MKKSRRKNQFELLEWRGPGTRAVPAWLGDGSLFVELDTGIITIPLRVAYGCEVKRRRELK